MEAARINWDWAFFQRRPFGFLMGLQTVIAACSYGIPYFTAFWYEGLEFIHTCVLVLFLSSLLLNFLHLIGWNRKVVSLTAGCNLFFPCAFLLFGLCLIYTFLMGFGSLIALIGFADSFRFTIRMIVTYGFLSAAYITETLICGYLVVLLARAAPNSQIFALFTVVIDGDSTSRFEHCARTFSSVATPAPGQQHI